MIMMLDSIENLEASERAWMGIAEILKQIELYLADAVRVEKGKKGIERHGETTAAATAVGRLSMLEGMIVEAARQAGRIAVRDPIQRGVRAKL